MAHGFDDSPQSMEIVAKMTVHIMAARKQGRGILRPTSSDLPMHRLKFPIPSKIVPTAEVLTHEPVRGIPFQTTTPNTWSLKSSQVISLSS